MKYYRFPDNRLTRIGFIAFLFVMLLLARDTLITSSILGFYKAAFISYGLIAIVGVAFLWVNRKNLKQILLDSRMLLVLIATVVFLVPMLVKRDWQLMYISILICIYFAIFLSYFASLEEVAKVYITIISFLAVYSLVATYLLEILVDVGLMNVPVFSNGIFDFYNFGLSYSLIASFPYYRNFGIFREPGVYQFFIILALVLNNYSVNWEKSWKLWMHNVVLFVTMLSTFATGGIIEVGLLGIVLFFDKKWYKSKIICIVLFVFITVVAIVVAYSFAVENMLYTVIWNMVNKILYWDASYTEGSRLQSVFMDLNFFIHNPLFGEDLSTVIYSVEFNTTSTMVLFGAFGLLTGCFHVFSWLTLLWNKERNVVVNLVLIFIMFMSFNTQNLLADQFFWLFSVLAMVEQIVPRLNIKRLIT